MFALDILVYLHTLLKSTTNKQQINSNFKLHDKETASAQTKVNTAAILIKKQWLNFTDLFLDMFISDGAAGWTGCVRWVVFLLYISFGLCAEAHLIEMADAQ